MSEPDLICYKVMPEWTAQSLPKGFQSRHNTKAGTWARLEIRAGQLRYEDLDEDGAVLQSKLLDAAHSPHLVAPQAWHRVEPASEDLCVQLSFLCRPQDLYSKKYGLTPTHSEVLRMMEFIQAGRALDIGSGRGRNALYLQQQGFVVDAFDPKPQAIEQLKRIIQAEKLSNLRAFVAKAQDIELTHRYDLIVNTVVLMFMPHADVPGVIHNMQNATAPGGINLIVCAMDSQDYPLRALELPFSFGFKEQELLDHYRGWEILRYNEDIGHLHRNGPDGNPIALRFATLVATKKRAPKEGPFFDFV